VVKPVGLALRLTAWALDLVLVAVLTVLLGRYEVGLLPGVSSIDTEAQAAGVLLFAFWMTLVLYHGIEIVSGRSPAKWLLGLAVRRVDGSRVPSGRRILRGLANAIPVMVVSGLWVFSAGLLTRILSVPAAILLFGVLPLLGPTRASLADLLAGTMLSRR
jgi:uncharacterized RDD family membrane protein YckC